MSMDGAGGAHGIPGVTAWLRLQWQRANVSRTGKVLVWLTLAGAGLLYLVVLAGLGVMGVGPIGFVFGALVLAWPIALFVVTSLVVIAALVKGGTPDHP